MSDTSILERLHAIAVAIAEARITVDGGGGVDLSELESAVEEVCGDISQTADPGDRAEIANRLQRIVTDLDELADSLTRQQQRLSESEGLDAAARRAYGDGNDPDTGGSSG